MPAASVSIKPLTFPSFTSILGRQKSPWIKQSPSESGFFTGQLPGSTLWIIPMARARSYYAVTDAGRAYLEETMQDYRMISGIFDGLMGGEHD